MRTFAIGRLGIALCVCVCVCVCLCYAVESPGTPYDPLWFVLRLATVLSAQGVIHVDGGLLLSLPGAGDEL